MGDEGEATPAPAAPAPAATPPAWIETTTAGANFVEGNAWLTAGAVVFYSTWALWVKLRKIRINKKVNDDDAQPWQVPDKPIKTVTVTDSEHKTVAVQQPVGSVTSQ